MYAFLLKSIISAHSNPQEWPHDQINEEGFYQGKLEPYISDVFVPYAREKKFVVVLRFMKSVAEYAKFID